MGFCLKLAKQEKPHRGKAPGVLAAILFAPVWLEVSALALGHMIATPLKSSLQAWACDEGRETDQDWPQLVEEHVR